VRLNICGPRENSWCANPCSCGAPLLYYYQVNNAVMWRDRCAQGETGMYGWVCERGHIMSPDSREEVGW